MNVTLTPQLEEMIRSKVESGRFADASEVVREALRLLDEHDKLAQLRAAIAVADDQIAQGQIVEWTPDLMDRLKREAAENVRIRKPIKNDVRP